MKRERKLIAEKGHSFSGHAGTVTRRAVSKRWQISRRGGVRYSNRRRIRFGACVLLIYSGRDAMGSGSPTIDGGGGGGGVVASHVTTLCAIRVIQYLVWNERAPAHRGIKM